MQLEGLLKSLEIYSESFFDTIYVIYKCSNKFHKKSYKILTRHYPRIIFKEENFIHSFKNILLKILPKEKNSFICFMVDDDMLYRSISLIEKNKILNFLSEQSHIYSTFSLRLGINCTYSHPAQKHFRIKNYYYLGSNIISWNWKEQEEGDLNYPLSLDGHIFSAHSIYNMLCKLNFKDPNTLEYELQKFNSSIHDYMLSFEHSRLVGVPINAVTKTAKNPHSTQYTYNPNILAQMFIDGFRIDISKLDFSNIYSAHQEIQLIFKKI